VTPQPALAPRGERLLLALFALHLLFAWAIAPSNVALGLAVLALGFLAPRGLRLPAAAWPAARLGLAYLLLLLAACAASPAPLASLRASSEIFSFATLGLTLLLVRDEGRLRALVDALLLVGAALALWGLGQVLYGYGALDSRIRGPFSHYMTFSGFLLMLDMMLVARLMARRPDPAASGPTAWLDRPWVAWGAFAAVTTALVASLTRGAWVALVGALVLVVSRWRPRLLWAAPALAAVFLVLAPVPVVARALSIADLTDSSNYDRLCMAEAGLRMIGERPLLGVGPEQVREIYPLYRHPTAPRLVVPHLHNAYLQLAAERGIPAVSAFVALLVTALAAALAGVRRGGAATDLHLGFFGAIAAFAVAALFEDNWGDTEVKRLALFLIGGPFCLAGAAAAEAAEGRG
jgi:putative inorganic carbon (HCO3(-)) transporter